jgi:AAA ATPase domain
VFVGREREMARIDELLEQARAGRSRVLLVEGEAGSGKTSLLNLAGQRAGDMTLLRAAGVEGGEEAAFSGLFSILRPIAGSIDELPEPQAAALRVVLGLSAGTGGNPFLVGLALLGMLAAAGERTPVLVVVDDLQWLDVPSAQALLFAARRLLADRVGMLIALRSGRQRPDRLSGWLRDLDVTSLRPLSLGASVELLSTENVAVSVAAELHRLTGGNPLALKEAAAGLSLGQRRGIAPAPDGVALPTSVRQVYRRQLSELPARTRQALLVAAIGRLDDLEILTSALHARSLELGDLAAAEDAGLLRVATDSTPTTYEWKHPLVRAAVLEAAEPTTQRAAHSAQADALSAVLEQPGQGGNPDQSRAAHYRATRAWHHSAATIGPDDRVADELAAIAAEASDARAHVAAAAAYQRSAALTAGLPARAERLTLAAEAAWRAGEGTLANGIVEFALEHATDAVLVRLYRLKGLYELEWGPSAAAVAPLVEAFRRALGSDAGTAMEIAAELVTAAVSASLPEGDIVACECAMLADLHADRTDAHQLAMVTWAVHAARLLTFGKGIVRSVSEEELASTYEVFDELAQQDPVRYAYYALMNNMSGDLRRACQQVDPAIASMRANGELAGLGMFSKYARSGRTAWVTGRRRGSSRRKGSRWLASRARPFPAATASICLRRSQPYAASVGPACSTSLSGDRSSMLHSGMREPSLVVRLRCSRSAWATTNKLRTNLPTCTRASSRVGAARPRSQRRCPTSSRRSCCAAVDPTQWPAFTILSRRQKVTPS